LHAAGFGVTKNRTPAKAWNNSAAALAGIIKDCLATGGKARGNGFGSALAALANPDVFNPVIALLPKPSANILNLSVTDSAVNFPGFTTRGLASAYYGYKEKREAPVIPDGKVCAIAADAPHWLPYRAVDGIDARPAPPPFFSKAVRTENPSAWELYGKPKPFPVPIVDAICRASVLQQPPFPLRAFLQRCVRPRREVFIRVTPC
jgi:hypothetical protein